MLTLTVPASGCWLKTNSTWTMGLSWVALADPFPVSVSDPRALPAAVLAAPALLVVEDAAVASAPGAGAWSVAATAGATPAPSSRTQVTSTARRRMGMRSLIAPGSSPARPKAFAGTAKHVRRVTD
jgi:hypothetical protein